MTLSLLACLLIVWALVIMVGHIHGERIRINHKAGVHTPRFTGGRSL